MQSEIYIKNVELSDGKKAVIKSKWKEEEVVIEVYVLDDASIFTGSCTQKQIKHNKINVDYAKIKDTLTSSEPREHITYELDKRQLKFFVIAHESFDTDDSMSDIIYLTVVVTRKDYEMSITMQLLDEMSEILSQRTMSKQHQLEFDEMLLQHKALVSDKKKLEDTLYEDFVVRFNEQKKQISKLELRLQKVNINRNKFANLSSDFDQSDVSTRENFKSESQESHHEPQPSTSKAPYVTPRKGKTKSVARSSPRTPKRSNRVQTNSLFTFRREPDSDDLLDDLGDVTTKSKVSKKKTPVKSSINVNQFEGINVKLTPSKESQQESSAELYIPKARKRLNSSSSDASRNAKEKSMSPEFQEPAQKFDEKLRPMRKGRRKVSGESTDDDSQKTLLSNSQGKKSDDDIFTQQVDADAAMDDEIVPNSQPFESPSIFGAFSKRRSQQSPCARKTKRSKFSIDTQDIFGIDSQ